jgi:hypothetical protein
MGAMNMKHLNRTLKQAAVIVSSLMLANIMEVNHAIAARTVEGLELLDRVGDYPARLNVYIAAKPSPADLAQREALAKNMGKAAGVEFSGSLALDKTRNAFVSASDPSATFEYDSDTGNFLFNAGMQRYRFDGSTKNLPQDHQVEELSGKLLEQLGLSVDANQLKLARLGGLNMAAAEPSGGSTIYEKLKTVRFSRVLDGLLVEGDTRIVVHLGENGALAGMVYQWPKLEVALPLDRRQLQDPRAIRDSALAQIKSVTGKVEEARLTKASLILYDDGRGVIEPAYHFVVERYFDYGDTKPVMIPYDFYVPATRQPQAFYPHMEAALVRPTEGNDEGKVENSMDE